MEKKYGWRDSNLRRREQEERGRIKLEKWASRKHKIKPILTI
jgi:hypothetical protein